MRLSHDLPKISASFDDPNLVSRAGLVPVMALAERAGLSGLAREQVSIAGPFGALSSAKAYLDGGAMRFVLRLALVIFVAASCAVGVWRTVHEPAQFALRLRPVAPMTTTACVSETKRFGYSTEGGRSICAAGQRRSWYRAIITNTGDGAYPACSATAVGPHGAAIFHGPLAFTLGGIPGLFVPGHRTITFSWYLPRRTGGRIIRYSGSCSVNTHPPT